MCSCYGRSKMDIRKRIPISPTCPAHMKTCQDCAWGFVTPDGRGQGEPIDEQHFESANKIGAYTSSCGEVDIYQLADGKIGAIKSDLFWPARREIEAYSRYMKANNLVHLDPELAI